MDDVGAMGLKFTPESPGVAPAFRVKKRREPDFLYFARVVAVTGVFGMAQDKQTNGIPFCLHRFDQQPQLALCARFISMKRIDDVSDFQIRSRCASRRSGAGGIRIANRDRVRCADLPVPDRAGVNVQKIRYRVITNATGPDRLGGIAEHIGFHIGQPDIDGLTFHMKTLFGNTRGR